MTAIHATVIVLDDEKTIAELIALILKLRGYSVYVADRCAEAEHFLRANRDGPALLITDVVMPDRNGPEFVEHLRSAGLEVPVLYMSGYADMGDGRTDDAFHTQGLLRKPFAPQELLAAVERTLYRTRTA